MTSTEEYQLYLPLLALMLFAIFLFVGSIVAIKSKRNICSLFLVISSGLGLISTFTISYITYVMFQIFNTISTVSNTEEVMKQVEKYAILQQISGYTLFFSYSFFAFTFVIFCCSIANIRKRNEQLEFLVEQLKENR